MTGCSNLGHLYEYGTGVKKDPSRAAGLFRKACTSGSMVGCFNLGILYSQGLGVSKNMSRAKELINRACEGGMQKACNESAPAVGLSPPSL